MEIHMIENSREINGKYTLKIVENRSNGEEMKKKKKSHNNAWISRNDENGNYQKKIQENLQQCGKKIGNIPEKNGEIQKIKRYREIQEK